MKQTLALEKNLTLQTAAGTKAGTMKKNGGSTGAIGLTGAGSMSSGATSLPTSQIEA